MRGVMMSKDLDKTRCSTTDPESTSLVGGAVCCADMRRHLEMKCDLHQDEWECADNVIGRYSDGRLGLIIHDGGSSMYEINYCPWCGKSVPQPGCVGLSSGSNTDESQGAL